MGGVASSRGSKAKRRCRHPSKGASMSAKEKLFKLIMESYDQGIADANASHAAGEAVKAVVLATIEACAARLEANAMACENPAYRSLLQANAEEIRALKGAT